MSPVRFAALAVRCHPRVTAGRIEAAVELELTTEQRWDAVAKLLGTGVSEQEAYSAMRDLFPEWFMPQDASRPEWFEQEATR